MFVSPKKILFASFLIISCFPAIAGEGEDGAKSEDKSQLSSHTQAVSNSGHFANDQNGVQPVPDNPESPKDEPIPLRKNLSYRDTDRLYSPLKDQLSEIEAILFLQHLGIPHKQVHRLCGQHTDGLLRAGLEEWLKAENNVQPRVFQDTSPKSGQCQTIIDVLYEIGLPAYAETFKQTICADAVENDSAQTSAQKKRKSRKNRPKESIYLQDLNNRDVDILCEILYPLLDDTSGTERFLLYIGVGHNKISHWKHDEILCKGLQSWFESNDKKTLKPVIQALKDLERNDIVEEINNYLVEN